MSRTCPHCATENPEDAAFCKACGRSLDFGSGKPGREEPPADADSAPSADPSGAGSGVAPPAEGPPQDRAAFGGFWRRVLAVLIDGVILGIPLTLAQGIISPETMHTEEWTDADTAWTFVNILVGWFYFAGMHSSQYRATIGKMVVGLRVVDWYGERISFARATGRHFAEFLSGLLFMIGYLMVAFTRQRRALHDFIAETWVVRREWLDE